MEQITKLRRTTSDTYEAAFYMMYGAEVESIRVRDMPTARTKKRGYNKEFVINLSNVEDWAYNTWRTGTAFCYLQGFIRERKRLKKIIRKSFSMRS